MDPHAIAAVPGAGPRVKILSAPDLAARRDALDADGRRLVFTNGCFDLLHVGHTRYLQAARALGDALAIGLNADQSVRALKGPGRPLNPADDRAEVLAALACVDYITIFNEPRATGLLAAVRPHVYVKGGDYQLDTLDPDERAVLRSFGAKIEFVPVVPGRSTTGIIGRMQGGGQPATAPLVLGVLGSGRGSNFAAIAAAIESGQLNARVGVVISDVPDAGILQLAQQHGAPALHLPPGRFKTKLEPDRETELAQTLQAHGVELVVLAGYMRLLKEGLINAFPRRIINVHPSLLPKFPGLEAWRQALESGEHETGCTVHYVDLGMDTGPIIAQMRVPILPGDSAETLHARIQAAEHALYPTVIADFRP